MFAPEMFTRNHDNIKAIKLVFEKDRNKNSSLWNSIIYMESFDEVGDLFFPASSEDNICVPRGKGEVGELGDRDWHVYTADTIHKIAN